MDITKEHVLQANGACKAGLPRSGFMASSFPFLTHPHSLSFFSLSLVFSFLSLSLSLSLSLWCPSLHLRIRARRRPLTDLPIRSCGNLILRLRAPLFRSTIALHGAPFDARAANIEAHTSTPAALSRGQLAISERAAGLDACASFCCPGVSRGSSRSLSGEAIDLQ